MFCTFGLSLCISRKLILRMYTYLDLKPAMTTLMYFLKVSIYLKMISHCLHCDPQPSGGECLSACEHFGPSDFLDHEDPVRTLQRDQQTHHLPVSLFWLLLAFTRLDLLAFLLF